MLVWPSLAAKAISRPMRSDVAALTAAHDVEILVSSGATKKFSRMFPQAKVHELTGFDLAAPVAQHVPDLLIVSDAKSARAALDYLPVDTPLVWWVLTSEQVAPGEVREIKELAPSLDAVLCGSGKTRSALLSGLGSRTVPVLSTSARVVPRGSEDSRGPGSAPYQIAAFGPLTRDAGFGDVIRGIDDSAMSSDDWALTIHGKGKHREPLERLVAWRGAQDTVSFAPEPARGSDDADQRLRSLEQVTLLATSGAVGEYETLVLDAAARGIPTVGFEGDPYAAAVARVGGGVLVPVGSHRALSSALSWLAEDADAVVAMARRAREVQVDDAPWIFGLTAVAHGPARRGPRLSVPSSGADSAVSRAQSLLDNEARDKVERAVHEALGAAQVPFAAVSMDADPQAIVAGVEHIESAARALLSGAYEGVESVSVWVRDHPAQSIVARTPDQLPEFTAYANRLEVVGNFASRPVRVDIDFWSVDAQGIRRAPRKNNEADWVAPRSWEQWLSSSSSTVTGLPLWDEVAFPVDAVFTWVDDSDLEWQESRKQHAPKGEDSELGSAEERFINRDEIYSSVAAARRNLPWLRRIILVTNGQRHAGIQEDFPEVEFVDHRDIFPDPGVLPVFNSHAIEAAIHRIPGLAEHFLYFNDDVFVVQPLPASVFFGANGTAKFFPSGMKVNFHDDLPGEPHLLAAANNRRLIAKDFGIETARTMLHTPHPHIRSVLEQMDERYHGDFERTRRSRFRSGDDLAVLSSFAQYYGWATRHYVLGRLQYRFVRLHSSDLEGRMRRVTEDGDIQVVCLGEPLPHQSRHENEEVLVRDFLRELRS